MYNLSFVLFEIIIILHCCKKLRFSFKKIFYFRIVTTNLNLYSNTE